ncbi:hypothetical protein IQ225_18385 [Synechocystis salina LEGE 06155]|uniref:hypothetical protein n=1 Tax=Synechocystis sp. LEGE 06083 TaxID=915336 RepID=UPI00187DE9D2|nr:hypothetical protein [Synechocystis sp. LEGE 06083]MBE9176794.1 hypothetical protein [Synechocystis salina LEGE 06155]MBE9195491.1 hypothetical protein [Synechocystis sp. LEGE 06083]
MDNFEESYKDAIEAGKRNLRTKKLLINWCLYAEFVRSPGRGIIEEASGLPIGYMGVQCKFSKKNSMYCWLLEDAAYDFYQNNCKGCTERTPVGFPNIMEFVDPREKAAEERRNERAEQQRERVKQQSDRREQRAVLRYELSLEENFVLDLLDELDQEDIARDDPRLEQLANLAPETFTRKVIEHILPAVVSDDLPYSMSAAKALLRTPLEPDEKLSVAVRLLGNNEKSTTAVEVVLAKAEKLSRDELDTVLHRFVSMALGLPPGLHVWESESNCLDSAPIHSLFQKRSADIYTIVDTLIRNANSWKISAAVEIILATDDDKLLSSYARSIFAKLMRRRTLFPEERQDGRMLHYLRVAASRCLEHFPEETDKIIQLFLKDKDDVAREEAHRTYSSVLKFRYREKAHIGTAQRIAFRRLLWAAIESPENRMDNAGQFLRHSREEFAQLAIEHFDDLIGAAATLSEKYEQVGAENSLELIDDWLAQLDRNNKRTAIDNLQEALIQWAAIGAKSKGREGIEEFLDLYERLPKNQTQMRAKMIVHISKLLTGVESLTLVLPDWYSALMDESSLVRASALKAWEDVPLKLVKNFPDLFFEAFSVLLTDPYVIVHKSAVRSLRHRSFPEKKRSLIKLSLLNLIVCYSQERKQEDFVVDCIDVFASLCLSPEERKGEFGKLLLGILLSLEGSALYHAVDQLHYCFVDVPGFVKVALKSIRDDYTRSISIDDCVTTILKAPQAELQNCQDDIKTAFNALKPFKPEDFVEILLYATALTKAGNHSAASYCLKELLANIPKEDRNEQWRLEVALVAVSSAIEHAIGSGDAFPELTEQWRSLLSDLEKENEKRAKLRDFPPSLFLES